MRQSAKHFIAAAGLFAGLSLTATLPASGESTEPPAPHSMCFYSNQFQSWKAPDARTIFIRVDMNRYYRLDLAGDCTSLLWPESHLIMNFRGPNTLCSALDWDLKVSQEPHGIPEACIVKTMTELSPAEASAIPPKFKP
jgi:hypothetical protein